jgi:NAD(P)-dependent dehydrogenase (short-subunit alcohol dehydrogenase family)
MTYFVTGATGLIGRNLVRALLERDRPVYALVRPGSMQKFEQIRARWGEGAQRVIPLAGDLEQERLGLGDEARSRLAGNVAHFFHLGALHDISDRDADAQRRTNVLGTRHAVELAAELGAGRFHHASSCAVAGRYEGCWREDMFDEWAPSDLPHVRTKHDAEAIVRGECRVPFRIYRPSLVVGRSDTGEVDEIDGLYTLFGAIRALGDALPRWLPLPAVEGGFLGVAPVDFVASALDHLAHEDGLDGRCFHLAGRDDERLGEVLNVLARVARAPEFRLPLDLALVRHALETLRRDVPERVYRLLPPPEFLLASLLEAYGVPSELLRLADAPTRFDTHDTRKALEGSGIECPPLERYVRRLWRYWEDRLDPDRLRERTLEEVVRDRVVLVTGASSGIGRATAIRFAASGARTLLAARSTDKLEEVRKEIEAAGGVAFVYTANLADPEQTAQLVARVHEEHGGVDVLINNAGRSINRSIADSVGRLHDFQRSMAINFFGPVALMLGFLPGMRERKRGHVINVLSAGAQMHTPFSAAYSSSKAALDAAGNSVRAEVLDDGVQVTNIYMGLVHTPMSEHTMVFDTMKGLTSEEAAELIAEVAIDKRTHESGEGVGVLLRFLWAAWPEGAGIVTRAMYRSQRELGYRLASRLAAAQGPAK